VKILLTGATGFVGKALINNLLSEFSELKALVRNFSKKLPLNVEQVIVGNLEDLTLSNPSGLSREIFKEVEVVIHAAARVHLMNDDSSNPLAEFRKVNRDATLILACLAAKSGVKRFIFLSSIKVNGETTRHGKPFTPEDVYVPTDPYALSKYEAEQGLLALAQETGMDVVIIRSPLVYGPGVKGNFYSMMKWMSRPVPLPFGAINNKRSLIALDNLVSFISLCTDLKKSTKASNHIFLICDCEDISTTQLLKKVRKSLNFQSPLFPKALLLPIPVGIMIFIAKFLGKGDIISRLFGCLQVDSSKTKDLLGWVPLVTIDEQLSKIPKKSKLE
jgi:nucleoside-diphosphate-sugar epimerase